MLHRVTKAIPFLMLGILLFSCANRHLEEKPERLPKRKEKELFAAMDSISDLRPATFYTKIKCHFSDTNQNLNFKTSIRIIKDSVINPLITFASIPVVGALIRPDSIIVSNKKEKCYVKRDLGFIRESFGVDFDYKNLEELLLGLPLGFDTTQKYFQINDPFNYILSSKRKWEIKRELKEKPDRDRDRDRDRERERERERNERERNILNRRAEDENPVILQYYLANDLRSIKRIHIDSPNDTTSITIDYLSRDSVSSYLIPNEVYIEVVTARNHIVLEMDYDKSEVNEPQEIIFVIPEEYGECGVEK